MVGTNQAVLFPAPSAKQGANEHQQSWQILGENLVQMKKEALAKYNGRLPCGWIFLKKTS